MYDSSVKQRDVPMSKEIPALEEFINRLQKALEQNYETATRFNSLSDRLNVEAETLDKGAKVPTSLRRMNDGLLYKLEVSVCTLEEHLIIYNSIINRLESIL